MKAASNDTDGSVPYFLLPLDDGRTKVVFTVPEELAKALISHPILCRGSCFALQLDAVSQRLATTTMPPQGSRGRISFLSTEFFSPEPEDTAMDISRRLNARQQNVLEDSDFGQVAAGVFGSF
jgi:hypothetical protein